MGNSIKESAMSNLLWRFAERCGAQGVSFVVSIILARLLEPEVYGAIAIVTVFTTILQVFVDSGMGNALIQKKNADDLDFSTVFFFNVGCCFILYIIMFFMAPVISEFYNDSSLTDVIRVLSLVLIISGIKNVQQAYVSRTLQFKRFFFATIGGTLGAAAFGIFLAMHGFGIWALVVQQLFNSSIDTLILWLTVKWRPKFQFSFKRLKGLLSYGWKLLLSSLMDTVYNEMWQLVIGKKYTSADLAYYNRGQQFPKFIVTNVNSSIDSVLLPIMSAEQDDKAAVVGMTSRAIKTSTYIMAPLMMGLFFTAKSVVIVLLTEKWLPCVLFLRIFCVTYLFYPVHTANLNAIKAVGRSDLFLKMEIIKKIFGMIILVVSIQFGVKGMAYGLLFNGFCSLLINAWPNDKLLGYSYLEQFKDVVPNFILALGMGICIWAIELFHMQPIVTLIIQVIGGAVIYIMFSFATRNDSVLYLRSTLLKMLKS